MLYLTSDKQLTFHFPEVHEDARLTIELQRTLRVPEDGGRYPLPASLGGFPIRHVEDHAECVPAAWLQRAGLMMPVYQSEAVLLCFKASNVVDQGSYPFAIKIGTGKINVVTGAGWRSELQRTPQDYIVAPGQQWLDGYAVGKETVRQFVAMPLCKGYTAEEQLTGNAVFGGIQIQVYPMKREAFERLFPAQQAVRFSIGGGPSLNDFEFLRSHKKRAPKQQRAKPDMGLAPGGRIRQQIFEDKFSLTDWEPSQTSRCFIHLCNSIQWRALTGEKPPKTPITPRQYRKAGIPWFEHYKEKARTLKDSAALTGLESVADHAARIGDKPPEDNESLRGLSVFDLQENRNTGSDREAQ